MSASVCVPRAEPHLFHVIHEPVANSVEQGDDVWRLVVLQIRSSVSFFLTAIFGNAHARDVTPNLIIVTSTT